MDTTPFDFTRDPIESRGTDAWVAALASAITSREELFDSLTVALNLPDYFGRNWDALSDVLRDLSWIEQRRVLLVHAELPGLPEDGLREYFGVLAHAVRDWKPGEPHELIVVVPPDSLPRLAALGP